MSGPIQIPVAIVGFALALVGLIFMAIGRFGRTPMRRRELKGMAIAMGGVTLMTICMFTLAGPNDRSSTLLPLVMASVVLGMSFERWRQAR